MSMCFHATVPWKYVGWVYISNYPKVCGQQNCQVSDMTTQSQGSLSISEGVSQEIEESGNNNVSEPKKKRGKFKEEFLSETFIKKPYFWCKNL